MSNELSKTYEPAKIEAQATRVWLEEKCFATDPTQPGEAYTIVMPPPNVTGALHLGHAINNTLQDILIRVHRMRGFNTLWIPGIDHAGIATQAVVEKTIKEQEGKDRYSLASTPEESRKELITRIWKWKEQYGNRILEQLKRLGCSCDWRRTRFTLDPICADAVWRTFFELFKDKLIYRGKRLVNWDIQLQTSISDDEIYHETVKTSMWHIRYPIVDDTDSKAKTDLTTENAEDAEKKTKIDSSAISASSVVQSPSSCPTFMTVATTRPETMLGDTAVAVHSQDPRWNWAIGKQVKLPLTDRLIPIIADDILVDPEFGSGVVKVTPAHDPNDYAVWQRHQGKPDQIDLINILNPDGTLNANGGNYANLQRHVARKKVVEDLTALGLLEKEEPYETQVGHSDRSKTPIEPYLSDQWWVEMAKLADPALDAVRNGTIKFFPERHAQQFLSWLGEKRDWPVSRQLWWGHRILVWHQHVKLMQYGSYQNSGEHPFVGMYYLLHHSPDISVQVRRTSSGELVDPTSHEVLEDGGDFDIYVCTTNPDAHASRLTSLGFQQEPDVLDTWFSSALWPHSTLGWPNQTSDLKKYYPNSVLVTARDIITLWVARMVMSGLYNMGQVPFHHVAINPTILDGKGERMSKSKGNGVDPVDIIDTHGADALRFTLALMATETQDVRLPVKQDALGRNTSDKFDSGRNFANKLWNAARFAISNLETIAPKPVEPAQWSMAENPAVSLAERWIISRFNRAVEEANAALAAYRFDQYAKICYDFFWRDFCDWYVEAIKPSLKDSTKSAQTANVLAAVLDGSLRLLHPMIPFITETIWWRLNEVRPQRGLPGYLDCSPSTRLVKATWPVVGKIDHDAETIFPRLQEIIGAIRNARNDYKADLKKVLPVSILAPSDLAAQFSDNRATIELLANCQLKDVRPDLTPIPTAAKASAAGCELFIEGLVDQDTQQQRTTKRKEELTRQVAAMRARLENTGYIAKAPPHLVEQTKTQLAEAEAELARLG